MANDNITFFDYLDSKNLESSDNTSIIRLYKIYILIEKIIEKDPINADKILKEFEEKVYTIGDKKIPKTKRIELELTKISKSIAKNDNQGLSPIKLKNMNDEIEKIYSMLKQSEDSEIDEELLGYMKKRISVMQAALGLNNTFIKETHDVFIENYRNLYINSINNTKTNIDNSYFDDKFVQKIKK